MPRLVALHLPTSPLFVEHMLRTWDAGDAVLPVDTRLPAPAVRQLLESMGADSIIDASGGRALPHGRPVEDGDALVIVTSGSSGDPKGVVHTHDSVAASARITSARLGLTPTHSWLACLPVSHIGGLSVVMRALLNDNALTCLESFDADAVDRSNATHVSLVATALARIDPTRWQTILLGGAAPPADLPPNVVITYGSTETGSGIVYDRVTLDQVRLRFDDSQQLLVQSPTLLRCYRNGTNPRVDGWYPTGDVGEMVDDQLHIFGRLDDVINTGGEKVHPITVEAALRRHPLIADALVFGEPDPEWGQKVVAQIVSDTELALCEVREHVKQTLPAYCAPKEVRVVQRLPRTPNGKVDRRESAR